MTVYTFAGTAWLIHLGALFYRWAERNNWWDTIGS